MNWYRTGTVSVNPTTKVVTGTGTAWLLNASPGDALVVGAAMYEIATVVSDTSLTVYETIGSVPANTPLQAYAIVRVAANNLTISGLAQQMSALLNKWNGRESEFVAWMSGTATGGAATSAGTGTGGPYYPMTSPVGVTSWIGCPASSLTFSGVGASPAELNFVSGVTSGIQAQLDGKIAESSGSFVMTATDGIGTSIPVTITNCSYNRVGKMVVVNINLKCNAVGVSGPLLLDGLPFAPNKRIQFNIYKNFMSTMAAFLVGQVSSGSTRINVYLPDGSALPASGASTAFYMEATFVYFV